MGWEKEYEGFLALLDAVDGELLAADGAGPEEVEAFLSENGEARRRFLKHALLTGGGIAAANLLLSYRLNVFARTGMDTNPFASQGRQSVTIPVTLRVNGRSHSLQLEPQVTLLDALRERIGLTGSKKGCDRGQCGACTVLADGLGLVGRTLVHEGIHRPSPPGTSFFVPRTSSMAATMPLYAPQRQMLPLMHSRTPIPSGHPSLRRPAADMIWPGVQ